MKNLKQLLIDRKYLEAKRIVLDSKKNLEQNVDILLERIEIEDSRTLVLNSPTLDNCMISYDIRTLENATGVKLNEMASIYDEPTNEESEDYTWKELLPTPALPPKETDKDSLEKWKELLPIKDFTPVGKLGKVTTSFRDYPCTLNKAAKIIEKCTIADDCKHGVDNPDCEKCRGLGVYDRTYFTTEWNPAIHDMNEDDLDEPSELELA